MPWTEKYNMYRLITGVLPIVLLAMLGAGYGLSKLKEKIKSKKYKNGDLVLYTCGDKKELGVVKRGLDNRSFVWYHSGGTASGTRNVDIKKISRKKAIKLHEEGLFTNDTSYGSLMERRRRCIEGGDTTDLIEMEE